VTRRRLVIVLAAVLVVLLGAAAAVGVWWWTSRPQAKLGSSTIEFVPTQPPVTTPPPQEPLPWPMFGYDLARTHFTPVHEHRPPFARLWTVTAGAYIEFPASVADGRVYVAQERGRVFAIDGATGQVLWSRQYPSCAASSPLVRGRLIFMALLPRPCPYGPRDVAGLVVGLDGKTGREVWRFTGSGPSESSLLSVGGLLYFGSWDHKVYAVDIRTRRVRWATETDAEIDSSPAYANGTIYIGTNGGSMYALDASTGAVRWQSRSYTHFPRGREYFYATPTVAYGRVFAGNTDGWVYAYGAGTGHLLWAQQAGTYVYTAPAAWNQTIYVGSYDGKVYAFDAATGRLRWTYEASGSIHGAPTVMAGLVYFSVCGTCGTRTGVRYAKKGRPGTFALDARTGKLVWTFWDGRYSPVVADEKRVYLMGRARVWGLEPCPKLWSATRTTPFRALLPHC
jgi:outer membrane protein assembly factor BamB